MTNERRERLPMIPSERQQQAEILAHAANGGVLKEGWHAACRAGAAALLLREQQELATASHSAVFSSEVGPLGHEVPPPSERWRWPSIPPAAWGWIDTALLREQALAEQIDTAIAGSVVGPGYGSASGFMSIQIARDRVRALFQPPPERTEP